MAGERYTEITLEDWDTLLKRSFKGLKPKRHVGFHNEWVIDLHFSPNVGVRIYTSIFKGSELARDLGADSIKLLMYYPKLDRPAVSKADVKRAFRTKNWRDTIKDHIGALAELYEEREGYWETKAGAPPETKADSEIEKGLKAVKEILQKHRELAMSLEKPEAAKQFPDDDAITRLVDYDNPEKSLRALRAIYSEAQQAIKDLERGPTTSEPSQSTEILSAEFTKLKNGDWGVKVFGDPRPGDYVLAKTKAGQARRLQVLQRVWKGFDSYSRRDVTVWSIPQRTASEADN